MTLPREEIARYLRMGSKPVAGALGERLDELLAAAPLHPRCLHLRDGDRFLVCATLGAEFDAWQRRLAATSAADAFIAQAVGTAALEAALDELEGRLKGELKAGERLRPRWSPGYAGRPLALSREILERLNATVRLGVSLTEALLLVPSKSVTAVCEVERDA